MKCLGHHEVPIEDPRLTRDLSPHDLSVDIEIPLALRVMTSRAFHLFWVGFLGLWRHSSLVFRRFAISNVRRSALGLVWRPLTGPGKSHAGTWAPSDFYCHLGDYCDCDDCDAY